MPGAIGAGSLMRDVKASHRMEQQSHQTSESRLSRGGLLLGALFLYLLPMAAVAVDELVLKTYWFAGESPSWVKHCLEFIYPFWKD